MEYRTWSDHFIDFNLFNLGYHLGRSSRHPFQSDLGSYQRIDITEEQVHTSRQCGWFDGTEKSSVTLIWKSLENLYAEDFITLIFEEIKFYGQVSSSNQLVPNERLPTIETYVWAWQSIFIAIYVIDIEAIHPVHALKLLKAAERYFAGSYDKL